MAAIFKDYLGRDIRMTEERRAHILEHPEMHGQENRIEETLLHPDSVIENETDSSLQHFQKLYPETPVTRKYLMVAVKYQERDAFIVTSFYRDREKKGKKIWQP